MEVSYGSVDIEQFYPTVVYVETKFPPNLLVYGTGFFVRSDKWLYFVTAEHVSKKINFDTTATIQGEQGKPFTFFFRALLLDNKMDWIYHERADIAVLVISPEKNLMNHLRDYFLDISLLEKAKEAPNRNMTITMLGFPLRLGTREHFSPISRETKAASGLVEILIPDIKKTVICFITQDPSVGGFSGAPVFDLKLPYSSEKAALHMRGSKTPRVLGIVSATLPDDTGGKFGVIIPSYLILEVIDDFENLHSISKCNRSNFKGRFIAQTFSGPCVD